MAETIYCEHLDDADKLKQSDIPPGSDVTMIKQGASSSKEIKSDNYAGSNDPVSMLLDRIGETTAVSFTCPMCRAVDKNPRVYFIYHDMLDTEVGNSFARLRHQDGKFVRDPIDEDLSPESSLTAYAFMS